MVRRKTAIWIAIAAAGAATVLLVFGIRHWRPRWSVIQGAVIRRDSDARKEAPIAGALVTASYGDSSLSTYSDASGYFRIAFPGTVLPGQTVQLSFTNPGYKPLNLQDTIRFRSSLRNLQVAAMSRRLRPPRQRRVRRWL